MHDRQLLADEIWRVVTSPYALSFKHLHDVIDIADGTLLQQWTDDHPCQIGALVRATLEGLEHSPYALSTLGKLAHVESIRDEFMRQRPVLLDYLLREASTCRQRSDQCSAACIVLLCKPLPAGIATPDALLPFLSRLLTAAIESTSVTTVRPVYSMLTRRQSTLVQVLPADIIRNLHDRLLRVLKHSDQQLLNLLCLGVFARLVSGYRSRRGLDKEKISTLLEPDDPHPQQDAVNIGSIEKFFNELKAPKTIQLVVLGVISAFSESSQTPLRDALETLSLATEILDTVEPLIKSKWIDANHVTMQKLYEKISRASLPVELQSQALEVALSLMGSKRLPLALVRLFQNLILNAIKVSTCCSSSIQPSTRILEGFIVRVDDAFLRTALRDILNTSVEQMRYTGASSRKTRFLTELVDVFSGTNLGLPVLGGSILRALSAEEFSESLRSFAQFSLPCIPLGRCGNSETCPVASTEARRELCLSACSLILQMVIQGTSDETRIEPSLLLKLLEKYREFAVPSGSCSFRSQPSHSTSLNKLSIVEQMSTPDDPSVSHDWGERLASNLLRDAKYKHETIVRMVGEVCRDLEDRCATVEAPLREEQAKTMKLSEELHAVQSELSQLESEADDRRVLMNGMDADRARLREEVKSLEVKSQDETEEIQQLHQQLQTLSRDAEAALAAAKERAEQQALEHLAILNVKEETIEELHAKCDEMEKSLNEVHKELERKGEEHSEARRTVDTLEDQLQSRKEELELQHATTVEQEDRIRALQSLEHSLSNKLEAANEELRKSVAEVEGLRARLNQTEKSLSVQIEDLTRARDADTAQAIAKEAQSRQLHREEIHNLKTAAHLERQGMLVEQQRKDSRILELEEKIERFKRERRAKAKEFAEAQDLSRRLLAVVGASTSNMAPHPSADGSLSLDEDSFNIFSSQRNRLGKAEPETQEPETRSDTPTQDSPTPKRHRRRKSQNMASLRPASVADGAKAVDPSILNNAVPGKGRQPLRESKGAINQGGSVLQVPRAPERHPPAIETLKRPYHGEGDMHGDEGMGIAIDTGMLSSFNGDFFGSTQKPDASDHHLSRSDGFSDDETTMDF